jgi:hypothetical protein
VRLGVLLRRPQGAWERPATVVDIHLAGAGVETDEALVPGERLSVAFAAPNLWDPLVLEATVAWSHPPRAAHDLDAFGRPRIVARAGLSFDYAAPEAVLAVFDMLVTLVAFE